MRRLMGLLAAFCGLGWGMSAALAEMRVAPVVGNSAYQNTTPLANPLARRPRYSCRVAVRRLRRVVEARDGNKRKLGPGAEIVAFFDINEVPIFPGGNGTWHRLTQRVDDN